VFWKLAANERRVGTKTYSEYRDFLKERALALGRESEHARFGERVLQLLAIYRNQFTCIRMALADRSFRCEQRALGTCCRAVPESQK
jgi:hypothetical protein